MIDSSLDSKKTAIFDDFNKFKIRVLDDKDALLKNTPVIVDYDIVNLPSYFTSPYVLETGKRKDIFLKDKVDIKLDDSKTDNEGLLNLA